MTYQQNQKPHHKTPPLEGIKMIYESTQNNKSETNTFQLFKDKYIPSVINNKEVHIAQKSNERITASLTCRECKRLS